MPDYWGGVSGSIRCSAANTLRLFNYHKRVRKYHAMSTIASYIDDGCHLLDRIPSNREQRRRDRASNLHQDALLQAHTSHQVQFSPTVKTSKWVPAANLNDTGSELGSAIDDGLGPPPPPPPPHIPPYTAIDKPPVRASTSVAHKMEWDIASDSLSYIDDGLGFQTSQTALPRASQANVEDSEPPKKAPRPLHRQSTVPAVNFIVPKPNTSLQRVARARNASKEYSSDVAKVTMEDIRSTIENIKAITSNIVPPRATKRRPIPILAPPKLPTFVIRNKADTRTVIVDGAEEPIQPHSRQGSLERTKAMPQAVELPVYPVFVNKVHYTPKVRPLMAISKPKNPEVHQGELEVIEPDPDPESSDVPVQKEGRKQQKKKGQVKMKKEPQPDQGKKNKKEGKRDPESPSTLIEPKSENDIDAWDEGVGIDNLVTSPPGGSPRLSNPDIFMSGGLGFLSPPTSVKSEKLAKKDDSGKEKENQKKKGKEAGGSKEEEDDTQTKGDDEEEDKKGDDGGMDEKGNDIEAANHNAGEWRPQTAKALNVWSGAEQEGQELGLGIQGGVSMPYGYPPFPRQQQEYMLPGFPGYPPQGFQYPLSGPVFPPGMQFLTDTTLQSAQDSPNYKPPAVESVLSTPTRTNAPVALPRTPGGRMANGYDDREGYCNQIWGGIPVRVAEWRL